MNFNFLIMKFVLIDPSVKIADSLNYVPLTPTSKYAIPNGKILISVMQRESMLINEAFFFDECTAY